MSSWFILTINRMHQKSNDKPNPATRNLIGSLYAHLCVVQSGCQHLHMVQRLLGSVLRGFGGTLGLLQLLNLGIECLMCLQTLLFQTLQKNLFSMKSCLRGGRGLGCCLGECVLSDISCLFGCRMLVGYSWCRLIGRSLRNRAETTSGTVSRLGRIWTTIASAGRRRVVVILEILSFLRFGSRLDGTWLNNNCEGDLVIFVYRERVVKHHFFLQDDVTSNWRKSYRELSILTNANQQDCCNRYFHFQVLRFFPPQVMPSDVRLLVDTWKSASATRKDKKTVNTNYLIIYWPFFI